MEFKLLAHKSGEMNLERKLEIFAEFMFIAYLEKFELHGDGAEPRKHFQFISATLISSPKRKIIVEIVPAR